MISRSLLLLTLTAPSLFAQANAVSGTDVNLYQVGGTTLYGRRGTYPTGTIGVGFGHAFCNLGSVHVPWQTSPTTSGPMTDVHFKIAFLVAREVNGRMIQVSTPDSYVKHSRVTYNLGSSNCGTCQTGPSSTFRMGCYDAYSTGFNGNQFNLGPATEIDPWLGSWNPVGSYFDRGDPVVAGAAANDGVQSLTSSQVSSFDAVKNRVTIPEDRLLGAGTTYAQVHLVCEGEPVANRGNNQLSGVMPITWNGSTWSVGTVTSLVSGSVLNRWTGSTRGTGGNGTDDGRFVVASKVTGPVNGVWHYEYAVHNLDNHRGGASLRIPLHAAATLTNVGFRDNDTNALNSWTWSRNGNELAFLATGDNPLNWNNLYNFWFDATVGPTGGSVTIDQARLGAGALSVAVTNDVPMGSVGATMAAVGSNCFGLSLAASARPVVGTTFQWATSAIPAGTPFGLTLLSFAQANPPLDLAGYGMAGCFGYVQGGESHFWFSPGASVNVPFTVPNDASFAGLPLIGQSFAYSPPLTTLGLIASNGMALVVGVL